MNRRIIEILLGLFAILLGIAGAWYGRSTYLQSVTVISLPVPLGDIPPYTLLTPEQFELREFPRALVESGRGEFARLPADLTGQISRSILPAGVPVSLRLIAAPAAFRLADLALEVVSLPVSPEMAVGGQVRIGEQVQIYRLNSWQAKLPKEAAVTFAESRPLEYAEAEWIATAPVVAVLAKDGTPSGTQAGTRTNLAAKDKTTDSGKPAPLQILVVAVPHEIAQKILAALALTDLGNNRLWITLAPLPSP